MLTELCTEALVGVVKRRLVIEKSCFKRRLNVDECLQKIYPCSADAICSNTKGSYNCYCKAGYTGDGRNCSLLILDCQAAWVKQNDSLYCMTSTRRQQMKNARQRCKEMSADLPIIKSQSENDFLLSLVKEEYVWLGMERNKSGFFWFDGSPAEPSQGALYSAWKNNKLERGNWIDEKCALLELNTKKWRDHKCIYKEKIYVLCQKGRA
ncbi:low affinity immunoglobulin epsilon Fc receptor-like [Acropora millepora]|uniref:low affinity immunoglobulin epsilon Fc receptor-like n=1 Tax=Acropora millepora TaxID=45264 RepID=UPI001CF5D25C|nr:low affinity immunoglobulin epsilon Fc receptor-like [Acropora millepora]